MPGIAISERRGGGIDHTKEGGRKHGLTGLLEHRGQTVVDLGEHAGAVAPEDAAAFGALDASAISQVVEEAQPERRDAGEALLAGVALSRVISVSTFQTPHSLHWPCHLLYSAPHSLQT